MKRKVKMRTIPKEFELRWVRFLDIALNFGKDMLDIWLSTALTQLIEDNANHRAREMVDDLLSVYYDVLAVK